MFYIFMVGLLGNAEMAAATAANVPVFIIQVVIFGFQSGMAVLVSQYWGRGDTDSINRCLGVALYAVTGFSTLLALITFLFPAQVLRLITPNEELVELAVRYIQIVGFSYIFNGISSIYAGIQRSTEYPAFGMLLFGVSMCVNTFLNFVLIFGHFGAPAMGITGAAAATLISRADHRGELVDIPHERVGRQHVLTVGHVSHNDREHRCPDAPHGLVADNGRGIDQETADDGPSGPEDAAPAQRSARGTAGSGSTRSAGHCCWSPCWWAEP